MKNVDLRYKIAPCFYEVHRALRREKYTHYWLKGGRASGKSSFASIEIVQGIMNDPDANAIVYRQVARTLRDTVVPQCLWAIDVLGRTGLWKLMKSPHELIYKPTGQKILFKGNDDSEKSKGIKLAGGYFKYIWFEELTEFGGMEEIESVLRSVVRGEGHSNVFYTYNPPKSANNWVNSECLEPVGGRMVHHSTYEDVPKKWLGKQFLREAQAVKERSGEKYRWAYLGEVTGTGGAVFDNVSLREIGGGEVAACAKLCAGLDFGYAVDPSAYVMCSYNRDARRLHVLDEFVAAGASYDRLAEEIRARQGERMLVADSSEPRSIDELRRRNLKVYPAKKGPGSVEHGIKWLQDLDEIVIDPRRTPVAAREFTGYEYPLDSSGRFKASYPDSDNHTIDAVRYALEEHIRAEGGRFVRLTL